jgi:hypothetical protein
VTSPAPPPTVALLPAGPGDLAWLERLARDEAVEPFLATDAASRLAGALAAREILVASVDGRACAASKPRCTGSTTAGCGRSPRPGSRARASSAAYDRHGRWQDGVLYALLADE